MNLKPVLGVLLIFLVVYGIALFIAGGDFVDALKVCGIMVCAFVGIAVLVGILSLAAWLIEG